MGKSLLLGTVMAVASVSCAHAQEFEIWHYYAAGSEAAGISALIEHSSTATGLSFESVTIPGNSLELRRQLQTSLMAGDPPALYQSSMANELKTFVDGGQLHPLTDVWEQINGDEIFAEGVQRMVKIDGVPYGVPFDLSLVNNIFYNKEIFDEVGLTPPTDWESFTATCQALRDAGYQPMGNAAGPNWSLYNFYAPLLSVLGKDGFYQFMNGVPFDSPEFREALDLYRDNMVSCYAENWSGKSWTQTADDLVNGDVAMYMMGIWAAGYMDQLGFVGGEGYDVFQAPGTTGMAIFQMDVLAVPEGPAETVEAAEQFIVAAAAPEGQQAFAVAKGSLAPNINVPASVYGYSFSKFAEQLAEASANDAVIPNPLPVLPSNLGSELGVQIERFAIDPSDAVMEEVVTTLEAARQEALAEGAFVTW